MPRRTSHYSVELQRLLGHAHKGKPRNGSHPRRSDPDEFIHIVKKDSALAARNPKTYQHISFLIRAGHVEEAWAAFSYLAKTHRADVARTNHSGEAMAAFVREGQYATRIADMFLRMHERQPEELAWNRSLSDLYSSLIDAGHGTAIARATARLAASHGDTLSSNHSIGHIIQKLCQKGHERDASGIFCALAREHSIELGENPSASKAITALKKYCTKDRLGEKSYRHLHHMISRVEAKINHQPSSFREIHRAPW